MDFTSMKVKDLLPILQDAAKEASPEACVVLQIPSDIGYTGEYYNTAYVAFDDGIFVLTAGGADPSPSTEPTDEGNGELIGSFSSLAEAMAACEQRLADEEQGCEKHFDPVACKECERFAHCTELQQIFDALPGDLIIED